MEKTGRGHGRDCAPAAASSCPGIAPRGSNPRPVPLTQALRTLARALTARHGRRVALLVALVLFGTLSTGLGLALLLPLLSAVGVGASRDPLSGRLALALGQLGLEPSLGPVLALFALANAFQALGQRAQTVEGVRLTQDFVLQVQDRLFRALERARWEALLEARASDILHGLTVDLRRLSTVVIALPGLAASLLSTAVYLAAGACMAPTLTLLGATVGLALAWTLRRFAGRAFRTGTVLGKRWLDQTGDLGQYLDGFKLARCSGAEERHRERLMEAGRELAALHLETAAHHSDSQLQFRLASVAVLAGLVYGALAWLRLPPAELLAMLYVFSRVVPLFSQAEQLLTRLAGDVPAWVQLEALVERLEAAAEEEPPTVGPPQRLERELRMEGVSYRYAAGAGRGVEGVDLLVPAGRLTALMGPSGAGKTTLGDLALGLLEPRVGRVLVDGQPLERDRWRRSVAYVPQEPWLFHGTIRENLLWARPEAAEPDLWEALEQAAAGFVRDLPRGLDTVVGDRGSRLSGGERQRLALARAFLRRPSLLVLDEPTSALDEESEERVMDVVAGLKGRVTVLLVTHRRSCARRADRVYRVEEGQVEAG